MYIDFSGIDIMTKTITKCNYLHPNVTKNEIQNIQHEDLMVLDIVRIWFFFFLVFGYKNELIYTLYTHSS